MVHIICNIKISAMTIRQKSNSNYDIDDFIIQLMASQKFDELAEKVADKAASRMKNVETAPARQEKFFDTSKLNKTAEAQQNYRDQSNREYEKEYDKENSFNNNIKLRNEKSQPKGKIDTQAVMMDETTSQSDNLRLKYKYLTRNAYEKKLFSERTAENPEHDSILRNDKNEETSKQNEKKGSAEKRTQEHDTKTEGHSSNQDVTEKNQHSTKNEFVNDENRWRHERESDRKDPDSNRNSNKHEKSHIDAERDENESKDHSREEPVSRDKHEQRHDQNHSREAKNSRPEFKSVVKTQIKKTNVDNSTTGEENNSSVEEDDQESQENNTPSEEEKVTEEVEKEETEKRKTVRGESEKSATEENVEEEELTPMHFRADDGSEAQEDADVDDNIVSVGDNTQDGEDHAYHKSDEDPSFSTSKPVIRREGDKLYAFVEAPGYEEYHEEVAKMAKDKGPNDFLL